MINLLLLFIRKHNFNFEVIFTHIYNINMNKNYHSVMEKKKFIKFKKKNNE